MPKQAMGALDTLISRNDLAMQEVMRSCLVRLGGLQLYTTAKQFVRLLLISGYEGFPSKVNKKRH